MPSFVIEFSQADTDDLKKRLGVVTDGELRLRLQWQVEDYYGFLRTNGLSLRDRKQLEDLIAMRGASRIRG